MTAPTVPYVLSPDAVEAARAAAAAAPPLTDAQRVQLSRLFALPDLRSTA